MLWRRPSLGRKCPSNAQKSPFREKRLVNNPRERLFDERRFSKGFRNRTGVHGFAVRCVTTPPPGHPVVDACVGGEGVRYRSDSRAATSNLHYRDRPVRGCSAQWLKPSSGLTSRCCAQICYVSSSWSTPISSRGLNANRM